jgi:hypothetical protein
MLYCTPGVIGSLVAQLLQSNFSFLARRDGRSGGERSEEGATLKIQKTSSARDADDKLRCQRGHA